MPDTIRVSEYEKLYYDESRPFKQRHWEALCRYQQSEKGNSAALFRIIHKGIQFTRYVGVIQAGNLTIEILPKTDQHATTAANENAGQVQAEGRQRWHDALVQMLQECRFLKIHHADQAQLNLRNQSILTIYLELFLAETEKLVHEGLTKKYRPRDGNQPTLKGQLLFSQQVTQNSIHNERFYTRSTTYDSDHLFNRLIGQTLRLILTLGHHKAVTDKANRLLLAFPERKPVAVSAATFQQLSFDRKTERYREAMVIAKMLLLNYRPDITGGNENLLAILFDMNLLWEEWIYRRLKKEEAIFEIQVQRQQSRPFWDATHLAGPKTIRPDIVITQGVQNIIVDTKWKLIKDHTPGDDDLKQLFVYNLYWQCSESVLLYPANEETATISGSFLEIPSLNNTLCKCEIIHQYVFDTAGRLNPMIGNVLLHKILPEKENAEKQLEIATSI